MSQNAFTQLTGDPFADTGGYVIEFLWKQPHLKDKSIVELVEYVSKIYVNNWASKLNAFFLNSTITQPAFKGNRKIDETLKYYRSLIDETAPATEGYCRVLGRKTKLFPAGRDNHILSGSGTFVNYHHSFDRGLLLSKEVLIRMFFVPFGLMQLGDKIALVYSSEERVSEFFVFQNCINNFRQLGSGLSEGILRSPFNNPSNALFQFIDDCLNQFQTIFYADEQEDIAEVRAPSLTLYHFTNFGASPEVVIHTLTSDIFIFYAFCNSVRLKSDWVRFVRAHYKNSKVKDATFDENDEAWKGTKHFEYKIYRTWRNEIFERMLNGISILPKIVRWSVDHQFPFKIVETYQTYIKNMEKRTLEMIRHIADFIVDHKEADYIEKCITRLNRERSANGLRLFVLRLVEQNYNQDAERPLVSLEDCAEYLFPDGGNWREIRDLLLIAIYERLHALKLKVAAELIEDENESVTKN